MQLTTTRATTRFLSLVWLLTLLSSHGFANETVTLFHGREGTEIEALPYVRPPYIHLRQFLTALGSQPREVDGTLVVELNKRKLTMDPAKGTASFNQKVISFPIRQKNGTMYVRVDVLCNVFTELMGRRMIYEATSRSLHLPLAEDLQVTIRTRRVNDNYRVILIYSNPVHRPTLKVDGRNLVLNIKEKNITFHTEGFVPNEAVKDMEIFRNLPDGSTEVLFSIGENTKKWEREPFNPENPRTVIKLSGTFEDPVADVVAESNQPKGSVRKIVIDPGHGGRDMGASGPSGLREKEVTLDLALMLQKKLEDKYDILLTRKDDNLVSLKRRTAMANHYEADLLISIHVNAINLPNATGSETYYLSLDAAEPVSPHYQEFEGDEETTDALPDNDLALVLWDAAQTSHAEDSFRIARHVQDSLNVLSGIRNRGVKQASLKVLKGAMMPAVLVEVAFISNPREESKLKTDSFREKIVNAIANAVELYDQDVRKRASLDETPAPPSAKEGR